MMSKDISKPGTLFRYYGKLYETVYNNRSQMSVGIQPVKQEDYQLCECGKPLPNQQHDYILYSPLLQDGITTVYEEVEHG